MNQHDTPHCLLMLGFAALVGAVGGILPVCAMATGTILGEVFERLCKRKQQ